MCRISPEPFIYHEKVGSDGLGEVNGFALSGVEFIEPSRSGGLRTLFDDEPTFGFGGEELRHQLWDGSTTSEGLGPNGGGNKNRPIKLARQMEQLQLREVEER